MTQDTTRQDEVLPFRSGHAMKTTKLRTPMDTPVSRRSPLVGIGRPGPALVAADGPGTSAAGAPVGRATPATQDDVDRLFAAFFAAKSAYDLDATMSFFDPSNTTYGDAVLGYLFPNWQALKAAFEQFMPNWGPEGRSTPTRVLGSEHGAVVFFTNTPELFGHEIRAISVVDIRRGKFVRWVDYWDGRHFGIAAADALRVPPSQFPAHFGTAQIDQQVSPTLNRVVAALSNKLNRGNGRSVSELFDEAGVLQDLTLHTEVVGPQSIAQFLDSTPGLPYGRRARVRHIVGGDFGGGYEWTNDSGLVPRGMSAIELNNQAKIIRLSSIWDGSLVSREWLTRRMTKTIER
jgi:hypothetical protein